MMFHKFSSSNLFPLPQKFNTPFSSKVPEVVKVAAREILKYIETIPRLHDAFLPGKMLGVLVVRKGEEIGYIAAYSGNIPDDIEQNSYFVPPVYDLRAASSFFPEEEQKIVKITDDIEYILNSDDYKHAQTDYINLSQKASSVIAEFKQQMELDKKHRDEIRDTGDISADVAAKLIKDSQFAKAEYKRLRKHWQQQIENAEACLCCLNHKIDVLRKKRAENSASLQKRLFEQFLFYNALGETHSLIEIFADKQPPAGAGECAAPRLLQYAYLNNLQPIGIGEFWYGNPLGGEVRLHGNFYEACVAKCHPILEFMLQGLDMARDEQQNSADSLKVIYEDDYIIAVDKPHGLLSVPGRNAKQSVVDILKKQKPYCDFYTVHRLDEDTSGVLLLAKSPDMQTRLQKMFACGNVKKKYVAKLSGIPKNKEGIIQLPIRSDYLHRPRQIVDFEKGKPATTQYKISKIFNDNTCEVEFLPYTGRTHQLRVHSAHPDGLSTPIFGDKLYGYSEPQSERMMLHAIELSFLHPITQYPLTIISDKPF